MVLRPSVLLQNREIDPAEIEFVSGRPDHGAEADGAAVELAQRFDDAWRLWTPCARPGFGGMAQPVLFDKLIHPVEEAAIGGIAIGEVLSEIIGKVQHAILHRLQPAKQRQSLRGKLAEIDGVPAIGSGDQGQRRVGAARSTGV